MIDLVTTRLLLNNIETEFKQFQGYLDDVKASDIPGACEKFRVLKELYEWYEALGKQLGEAHSLLKQVIIPDKFEATGTGSYTSKTGGYRVGVSSKVMASVLPGMKEQAYDWLRENELGDLIQPTVNASTLAAAAKALLEEGKELSPDYFKTYLQPNTSLTKIATKQG